MMALEEGGAPGDWYGTWKDEEGSRVRISHDDDGGLCIRVKEGPNWWKYVFLGVQDKAEIIRFLRKEV